MRYVLLVTENDKAKHAVCEPLIAAARRTVKVRPIAWKSTDPVSHDAYELDLDEQSAFDAAPVVATAECTLIPTHDETVESALAEYGLCVAE